MPATGRAVVFFCHGSRSPAWREPFEQLLQEYRQAHPQHAARLAFLELMTPTLPAVLGELAAAGHGEIEIHPLFLADGAHTRVDLPRLVAESLRERPGLKVTVHPALLESARFRSALVAALGNDGIRRNDGN